MGGKCRPGAEISNPLGYRLVREEQPEAGAPGTRAPAARLSLARRTGPRDGPKAPRRIGAAADDFVIVELWRSYKPECSYYEVVECLRRVILTGMVVSIYPGSTAQISTTFLIALFFFALSEVLDLSLSQPDCWMHRCGNLVVIPSMFIALLLKVGVSEEETDLDIFGGVLAVCNIAMALVIVGESIVSIYSHDLL